MVKQLPLWGKILYGFPPAGYFMLGQALIAWIFFYYTTGGSDGLPLVAPAVVGSIMLFGRIVDAITDPIVATFSDRMNSPWGRRIPFMAVSGILLSTSFIILFYPPMPDQSIWNALFLTFQLSIFFTMYTGYANPYLALLPELARTTRDQVDLSTFKAVFAMLGTGAGLICSGLLISALGYKGMGWVLALTAMLFMYAPMVIREKDYADSKPSTLGLIESVKSTLQNKPFRYYLAGCISFWFGGNIILQAAPFYASVLMKADEGAQTTSFFYMAAGAVAILSFPLINFLAKKWGQKAMMMLSMLILTIFLPFYYFIGQSFLGIDPLIPALIAVSFAGFPIACLFIVPDALVASIAVYDKKKTGQAREGMFYGTQGLIMKSALGFSTFLMGTLFQIFGQTAEQPLGVQLTGPVAAFFVLIGLLIFTRYPEKEIVGYLQEESEASQICGNYVNDRRPKNV